MSGTSGKVKIFNAYKNPSNDRQIGDRRARNALEGRIKGPSAQLPVGAMIGRIVIPKGYGVKVCIADRSDYYHHLAVSSQRSFSNLVWPPMQLSDFKGLSAYDEFNTQA